MQLAMALAAAKAARAGLARGDYFVWIVTF
jgi:hypothetical protein